MDHTIERHLGSEFHNIPVAAAAISGSDGMESREATLTRLQDAAPGLARALHDLLERYVSLLESAEHGGWTRDEDEIVRIASVQLIQSGWKP